MRRHGWAIQGVLGEDSEQVPGFSYTVGLWGFGHPELVVFGLEYEHAGRLLNEVGEQIRGGLTLVGSEGAHAGSMHPSHRLRVFPVPNPESVILLAQEQYRTDGGRVIPALQLVYADLLGAYPWEPRYRYPRWMQPMPGTFAA
ncbi:MAG: DUF4262 domain-containing protein [Jatrophihabitantaceae bacterium]